MTNPQEIPEILFPKPVIHEVATPDGRHGINALKTAEAIENSLLPTIGFSELMPGDVVVLEHTDPDRVDETYNTVLYIEAVTVNDMSYGSSDISSPQVVAKLQNPKVAPSQVLIVGSTFAKGGSMMRPSIVSGLFLQMRRQGGEREYVATEQIDFMKVLRPNAQGELEELRPNQEQETLDNNEDYAQRVKSHLAVEAFLAERGFTFQKTSGDETYLYDDGKRMLYAGNQGFGCGITPQHEVWIYDRETQVLIASRYVESLGLHQVATAVTSPENLQRANFDLDSHYEGSTLYRLDGIFTTYNSSEANPNIDGSVAVSINQSILSQYFTAMSRQGQLVAPSAIINVSRDGSHTVDSTTYYFEDGKKVLEDLQGAVSVQKKQGSIELTCNGSVVCEVPENVTLDFETLTQTFLDEIKKSEKSARIQQALTERDKEE